MLYDKTDYTYFNRLAKDFEEKKHSYVNYIEKDSSYIYFLNICNILLNFNDFKIKSDHNNLEFLKNDEKTKLNIYRKQIDTDEIIAIIKDADILYQKILSYENSCKDFNANHCKIMIKKLAERFKENYNNLKELTKLKEIFILANTVHMHINDEEFNESIAIIDQRITNLQGTKTNSPRTLIAKMLVQIGESSPHTSSSQAKSSMTTIEEE
jgi:hypothetical protein